MTLGEYQLDQARRNLSGYAVFGVPPGPAIGVRLGAITPSQAWKQAASGETGPDFSSGGWAYEQTGVQALLDSGQINAQAWSPNCAGMPAPNLNLFQTASGLALGTTAAGVGILGIAHLIPAAAIPVVGVVIAGAGAVIAVISTILAHHGAAVRQEQQLGCAAIAAVNNAVGLIDQAVRSGQMRPTDAMAGLDALVSKVSAFVAPAVKHNPCNANCELLVQVKAVVNYRKSIYADLAAAQSQQTVAQSQQSVAPGQPVTSSAGAPAQPGTGSTGSGPSPAPTVSSGSVMVLPSAAPVTPPQTNWLMIAALVAGGFALARYA